MRVTQDELLADLSTLCATATNHTSRSWWIKLNDAQKSQLLKLRKDFHAGKFDITIHRIYSIVKSQGYEVGRTTFYDWVRDFREEPRMAKSSGGKGGKGSGDMGGKGGKGGKGC